MPIRSMTGFAQVRGQANGESSFSLSLKSVNHRFLDLHFRMPSENDALEMKLRRLLKERMARGHIEVTFSLGRGGTENLALNRQLVGGYIQAFRAAAAEFGLAAEPDLNVIMRLPGAMDSDPAPAQGELETAVLAKMEEALKEGDLYVVNWKLSNVSANTIIAYVKEPDSYGTRLVAKGDGSVTRMSKEEFEKAKTGH